MRPDPIRSISRSLSSVFKLAVASMNSRRCTGLHRHRCRLGGNSVATPPPGSAASRTMVLSPVTGPPLRRRLRFHGRSMFCASQLRGLRGVQRLPRDLHEAEQKSTCRDATTDTRSPHLLRREQTRTDAVSSRSCGVTRKQETYLHDHLSPKEAGKMAGK